MQRSIRIALPIAAVALVLGSLGVFRVNSVQAENAARTDARHARSVAVRELRKARAMGLSAQQLQPLSSSLAHLNASPTPQSTTPWDTPAAAFYRRQAGRYRRLMARVQTTLWAATSADRAEAMRLAWRARHRLLSAKRLDIATGSFISALTRNDAAMRTAQSPIQLAPVILAERTTNHQLRAAILSRRHAVQSLIASSGGDHGTLVSKADSMMSGEADHLILLNIFSHQAAAYHTALQRGDAAVRGETTLFRSALKLSELATIHTRLDREVARVVPRQVILVSTEQQSATMYQDARQIYATPVTTGGPELPTDLGIFHIYFKASPFVFHSPWPPASPYYYNPTPITFWMPFDGAEGLHDASWRSDFGPGSNLSPTDLGTGRTILGTHGCVNLPFDAAQFVWTWAPVGTTVVVV